MACKSRWLLQIPEIIRHLSALDTPVIDRAICESLFGVKRRRAIALVQRFGGYQTGHTVLIDRLSLIKQLEAMQKEPEVEQERERKQRLADHLVKLEKHRRARAVRIPIRPDAVSCTMTDLPAGVWFEPGKLTVVYEGVEQLLGCLYELAQAAANDFDAFARAAADGYPSNCAVSHSGVLPLADAS